MQMNKVKKDDFYFVRSLILMVVSYAAIALLSGVFGVFYPSGVWSAWFLLVVLLYIKKVIVFPRPSQELTSHILIALAFSLIIAFFTVPTIFSGRDQGSLSEAAMQLSHNHHLISHSPESDAFFEIYGRGKALNFPGFFYIADGGLLTQFPLPYITYLAGFFGAFAVNGLIFANIILLTIFIVSATLIARYYVSTKHTFVFLILLLSSFAIGWFAKFTLSENIASMLLWSTTLLYIGLKKHPEKVTYFTFFISLSLLLFSRLEGIWFFAIFILLALRNKTIRDFLKKDLWWHIIFPLTTLFTISCVVAVMNLPFITTMAGVFFDTTSSSEATSTNLLEKISYLFSVYTIYGLLGPLILTVGLSTVALRYKKYRFFLLPIAVTLPLFSYYLFPHISSDHPWMLRRFVFALLPATILMSTFFIALIPHRWPQKKLLQYTLITTLFLMNIPAFATFITYAENTDLRAQIHDISLHFSDNDLILIDKDAAGSGWSMITNPMRSLDEKHAVYFFNTFDFEKIDTSNFAHIYLITPNENSNFYKKDLGEHMRYVDKYTITNNQLQIEKDRTLFPRFPEKNTYTVRGTIYELKK